MSPIIGSQKGSAEEEHLRLMGMGTHAMAWSLKQYGLLEKTVI